MPSPPATVRLDAVTKTFGDSAAVDDLTLEVAEGEFFSLLGPSGCGKTTTLRILAGFLIPDSGEVLLQGQSVTRVPPYRRDVNTVFQSYALFNHLTVADNVAFGLKRRKVPRPEIRRRVEEMLDLVDLKDRAAARPAELSGGQRQRVALARSLVNYPKVLLLDEPLGALDLKLRRQMQVELTRIQREVGITFIYVTHDQEEAITMSDRIAVMNSGRLEQVDTPQRLYEHPSSAFVAGFVGNSNLIRGDRHGDAVRVSDGLTLTIGRSVLDAAPADGPVLLMVRPENVVLCPVGAGVAHPTSVGIPGTVTETVYLGATTQYRVDCGAGLTLTATEATGPGHRAQAREVGSPVTVTWREEDLVVLRDS